MAGMGLSELRRAMHEFTTGFDAALMTPRDAEEMLDDAAAVEKMAATVKSLLAARIAGTEVWKLRGERSAARDLARRTGSSVGRAQAAIMTGRLLCDLPVASAAAKRGELSPDQAAAIADAATDDPDAEERLVGVAKSGSLGELRKECARTKANVCDPEDRRRRIHDRRYLRSWTDPEGAGHLHVLENPEVIAEILSRVAPVRDDLARTARATGRHEPLEAHAADALRRIVGGGNRLEASVRGATKILVRIDLDALLRGYPGGDETCEIAGFGPVAVSAVRDMLETGDPFLAAIVTKGANIVGIAHLGRRPTARQRSALEWLYPTCAAEGCNSLTFLEFDHREDWSKTRLTVFDLLDRLCHHHHDLKTTARWSLVEGRGKRAFVAPDDPRHPRHAKRHAAA